MYRKPNRAVIGVKLKGTCKGKTSFAYLKDIDVDNSNMTKFFITTHGNVFIDV